MKSATTWCLCALLLSAAAAGAEKKQMQPIPGISPTTAAKAQEAWAHLDALVVKPSGQREFQKQLACTRAELVAIAIANHDLSPYAIEALERHPEAFDESDVDRLVGFVTAPSEFEGMRAMLAALVARNAPIGVARLEREMKNAADPSARVYAAAGLVTETSKASADLRQRAGEALLEALGNSDDSGRVAGNHIQPPQNWMYRSILDRLGKPETPPLFVERGLMLLTSMQQPPSVSKAELRAAFETGLKSPSINTRINSVNGLRGLGITRADLPLYERIAKDPNEHVRRMLWAGLGEGDRKWAAPLLMEGLADSLEENRVNCATALGTLRYRPAVPRLMALVDPKAMAAGPFPATTRAAAGAVVSIAGLKDMAFGQTVECREMGEGMHAMIVVNHDEEHRKALAKLLQWWDAKGKKEFSGAQAKH